MKGPRERWRFPGALGSLAPSQFCALFFNLFAGARSALNEPRAAAAVARITRCWPGCEQFKSPKIKTPKSSELSWRRMRASVKSKGPKKSEIRRPKSEGNPKSEGRRLRSQNFWALALRARLGPQALPCHATAAPNAGPDADSGSRISFGFRGFGFRVSFGLRPSDFGFRISGLRGPPFASPAWF
jgi:hypothetical protein